jgi:hypothetical protein
VGKPAPDFIIHRINVLPMVDRADHSTTLHGKAMPLVVLEIAGVYGSIGVGHDTKAVSLVGDGVTFSLVSGVSIIDYYDGGV